MAGEESLATPAGPTRSPRLRQQDWALHAYRQVGTVPSERLTEYRVVVNDLGANIMRSGLAAAISALERTRGRGGLLVLAHLAAAGITGLAGVTADDFPRRVRALDRDDYVIATREMLQVAAWLRRAAQAAPGGG